MPGDVAALIGPLAERVENRSLLLDKFVFHKHWPIAQDEQGREIKWDEASRWSFMRIADGASALLSREADERRRKAGGRNVEPKNRDRYLAEAEMASGLSRVKWDDRELTTLRSRHTRRFIALFRQAHPENSSVIVGQLEGRLAINLADSLVPNAGICLDRLFGLPFIPGSAVKGVCRHAALQEIKETTGEQQAALFETFRSVFGTADSDYKHEAKHQGDLHPFRHLLGDRSLDLKGAVSFLPAYPLNEARMVVDLTNVHTPEYYRSGRMEDLSKENPQPNSFPAVEVGAQFAFCLVLSGVSTDSHLLKHAQRWLESALTVRGLGAKTAAGYGWFSLRPDVLADIEALELKERTASEAAARASAEEAARRQAEAERQASLSPEDLAAETLLRLTDEQFALFGKELGSKPEIEQKAFIRLLSSHKEKRERWKTWKKKKPEIAQPIESLRSKLNLPPLP